MNTRKYKRDDLQRIAKRLLKGDIIAFPTDTVFGLACVYDDEEVVEKIYAAKGRNHKKALPMMCSSIDMAKEYALLDERSEKLMRVFSPGALTYILDKQDGSTIAVRIPDDKWIRELIDTVKKPLLVTSANISDTSSLKHWKGVYMQLNGLIDGIVTEDAETVVSSTIVDARDGLKILREGVIPKEEIEEAL